MIEQRIKKGSTREKEYKLATGEWKTREELAELSPGISPATIRSRINTSENPLFDTIEGCTYIPVMTKIAPNGLSETGMKAQRERASFSDWIELNRLFRVRQCEARELVMQSKEL